METIATPAIYKIFSAGRKQSTGSLDIISDTVIHDCSGAYEYIDLMLQEHQFSKSASIFAIAEKGGKEFQLKPLPEYAKKNQVRFFPIAIPYAGEEKAVLQKPFPESMGIKFWEWSFMNLIPEHHQHHAFNLVDSLLEQGYHLIFCKDHFRNTRIVISTLRGKGKQFREDLLAVPHP